MHVIYSIMKSTTRVFSEIMKSKDVKWHIFKKLNPMYFKYYDNTTLKVFLINIECKSNPLKSKSKKKKKKGEEI